MELVYVVVVAIITLPTYTVYYNTQIYRGFFMKEVWLDVIGLESTNEVSNLGNVRLKDRVVKRWAKGKLSGQETFVRKGCLRTLGTGADGYYRLCVNKEGSRRTTIKVHRWVAEAFIPNPENKPQVNHINGVKTDNRVENLEWCTASDNIKHSFSLGLSCNKGENHPSSTLKEVDVMNIRLLGGEGVSRITLSTTYKVSLTQIGRILNRKSWSHL